jgi:hypothetical protein
MLGDTTIGLVVFHSLLATPELCGIRSASSSGNVESDYPER